jgi:hypothetical protein
MMHGMLAHARMHAPWPMSKLRSPQQACKAVGQQGVRWHTRGIHS